MKKTMMCMLLCIGILGCGGSQEQEPLRQQMMAQYGENRVLDAVPDGQPTAVTTGGVFVGRTTDDVTVFKGIPYAKPPVGERRWRVAEDVDSSSVIHEALYYGKSAIQTEAESERASYYPQSEDCLTLNVWSVGGDLKSPTPEMRISNPHQLRPVMVWIHGGSYGWGGTSDPLYDGTNFVKAHPEVVLVTVNYRVGIMGFLDLTQMEGGEAYGESGNLGLLDQVAALRWVQRNIAAFGGDASRVTVFGESAGGGSVSLLPLVPQAKGLFRRVIAQSGSVALSSSREEHRLLIERVKKATGARNVGDLMAMSEEELKRVNEQLNEFNCFPLRDGRIVPLDPYKAYADGAAKDIEMMMGTNADEVRYWIGEMGGETAFRLALPVWYDNIVAGLNSQERELVEAFVDGRDDERIWNITELLNELMFRGPMLRMAEAQSEAGGQAYVYYWSRPSLLPNRGACHAVELAYVLCNPQEQIYTGGPIDTMLMREASQMWVNFALTGNPSTAAHPFPAYDTTARQSLRLDSVITTERDLLADERQLVAPLLGRYISPLYCNISLNVPTVWRYAAYVLVPLLLLTAVTIWLWRRHHRHSSKQL